MKVGIVKRALQAGAMITFCGILSACTSLQSQMSSYDSDLRSLAGEGRWNSAKKLIDTAKFDGEQENENEVSAWRNRERIQLKKDFASSLQRKVSEVKACYAKGQLSQGDKKRLEFRETYFGQQDGKELDRIVPRLLMFKGEKENGIPEELVPCLDLAWVEMLSDRNLARMTMAFNGFKERIQGVDIQGARSSIKQLDEVKVGYEKACKWKDKVDLFMEMLSDKETRLWAPIDRSTYAVEIKKMETARAEMVNNYLVCRWDTSVTERKKDYAKITGLVRQKNYTAAMQMLSTHNWLVRPDGMRGGISFEDEVERANICNQGMGETIAKQIFETGLNGVQYHRMTTRGKERVPFSILVVGRAPVDGDVTNKRKLREAGRVAQMQARTEFVKFMSTAVSASDQFDLTLNDDEAHQSVKSNMKEIAQSEISNMTVVATGVDNDEVVVIMGWRTSDAGTVAPAPMHRDNSKQNFTVSPSVGAYL